MKRIIYTLIIFTSLSLTSCEGFLDKGPRLSVSTESLMSTYSGLDKAVSGAYFSFYSGDWYSSQFIIAQEMRSGNAFREADGEWQSGRFRNEYSWTYFPQEGFVPKLWEKVYYAISAANNVLVELDRELEAGVTEQDIENLKAECLFIRALSHFDLVLYHGQPYTYLPDSPGVPIVLITNPNGKPARSTVRQVYNQVVTDLLEAESVIAPDYKRAKFVGKSSVSLYAIQALLSRVYLYMGDWQKSADYATKVISSGKFNMWTATQYEDVWTVDGATDAQEVIFEIYGSTLNTAFPFSEEITGMTDPVSYSDAAVSQDVYDLFTTQDVREKLLKTDAANASGFFWTTKYDGKGLGEPDASNIIVLRLSEMYLNRAEALSNGAAISGATALADLNTIRTNRGLTATDNTSTIKLERRLEFLYEGHYLFDLARWGQGVERTHYNGADPASQNIPFPDYRWALPIPEREIEVNENLVQNEGYN